LFKKLGAKDLELLLSTEDKTLNYSSIKEKSFVLSLLSKEGKYSYHQGSTVFKKVSSYKLKRFLDEKWNEEKLLDEYLDSLDIDWSTGSLIADDTVIEKPYAEKIQPVYWQYSSKNNDFILGINLTILLWSDGKRIIPIKFMVYEKDLEGNPLQTKNEFVVEALKYAHSKGINPESVLMDSKYSSSNILNQIESFNWKYYTQLPCNRGFNGQQLKTRRFQPYSEIGYLKGVGHRVCVAKHKNRYYATNATENRVTREQIVKRYRKRWVIEVLFRELKQCCHLQECQSLKGSIQKKYVAMCLKAHLQLQEFNQRTIYQAKLHFLTNHLGLQINADRLLNGFAA